jgi:hypothetical protein
MALNVRFELFCLLSSAFCLRFFTVSVAQLVERWIVAPVAVGSNPIAHPFS